LDQDRGRYEVKVALAISHLGGGGAERACVLLAEGLRDNGFSVTVMTLSDSPVDFYSLPDDVGRVRLHFFRRSPNVARAAWNFARGNRILRRALAETGADCVVSFTDQINIHCGLALAGLRIRHLASVQIDPHLCSLDTKWRVLRRLVYPRIDRIVSASSGSDSALTWLPSRKRCVIHNPLPPLPPASCDAGRPDILDAGKKWILAVGRLTSQKGHDILLRSFHEICSQFPEWNIVILGEGGRRDDLIRLADSLSIRDRVVLPGAVRDVFPWYFACDLFVLPSRFEGFGNVLAEAMSCGLPVISTDCPSGPGEIVQHGVDGQLVPADDPQTLAQAMTSLMADASLRKRLGEKARKVVNRFSLPRIAGQWEDLIRTVASESAKRRPDLACMG